MSRYADAGIGPAELAQPRSIRARLPGQATSDGAGVRLTRLLPVRLDGQGHRAELDPFLLLDAFHSDQPDDYIAGFPPHPHRGFETVTYLLAGRMRHRDSAGHAGVIEAGGAQWMTAGSGILHSEMPEQQDGLLSGFQLWVNLPADRKMEAPRYQEFGPAEVPEERLGNGARVRVLAGTTAASTRGPVTAAVQPLYLDINLPAGAAYAERLPIGHTAMLYLISGEVAVRGTGLSADQLGVLGDGDGVVIEASADSRLLLIAGRPIGEPIARHGPFVMNTDAEITQAYRDYRDGRFGRLEDDGHAMA